MLRSHLASRAFFVITKFRRKIPHVYRVWDNCDLLLKPIDRLQIAKFHVDVVHKLGLTSL